MFPPQTIKEFALLYAWNYLGKWYKWGGDDPSGFDCSGFMIEILKGCGLLPRRYDTTASGLYYKYKSKAVQRGYAGCLVFWQANVESSKIVHVEMMMTSRLAIGASGGGSKTRTVEDAIRDNAFIKVRDINTRPHVFGFVDPFKGVEW